jgi:dynactin complex subunit
MPSLNERLSCDGGRRGTVRFIGALDDKPTDVVWVGIEWDNAEDGKHDGTVGTRRYFHCRDGGKASFIKLDKLKAELAVSFDEAYQARSGTPPARRLSRLRVPETRARSKLTAREQVH